jgi:hypothetical protein
VVVIGNPPPTPNPNGIPIPAPTDNVLFGAAAIAAIGATMAIVLDDQRKRQQLLDEENAEAKAEAAYLQARSDAEQAEKAAQAKAHAKYQAALYGQYEAQQQELDAGAALAATRNTLPSDVVAVRSGTLSDDPETDDTDANVAQAFREADAESMAGYPNYEASLQTTHTFSPIEEAPTPSKPTPTLPKQTTTPVKNTTIEPTATPYYNVASGETPTICPTPAPGTKPCENLSPISNPPNIQDESAAAADELKYLSLGIDILDRSGVIEISPAVSPALDVTSQMIHDSTTKLTPRQRLARGAASALEGVFTMAVALSAGASIIILGGGPEDIAADVIALPVAGAVYYSADKSFEGLNEKYIFPWIDKTFH